VQRPSLSRPPRPVPGPLTVIASTLCDELFTTPTNVSSIASYGPTEVSLYTSSDAPPFTTPLSGEITTRTPQLAELPTLGQAVKGVGGAAASAGA